MYSVTSASPTLQPWIGFDSAAWEEADAEIDAEASRAPLDGRCGKG